MTALKSLLFLILVPGLMQGYFPYLIAIDDVELFDPGIPGFLAVPLWLIGATMMLWCFWNFTFNGIGTPAPIDPPKELVAVGLYCFVHNPMYVGVLLVIISHFLWFGYWNLLVYAVIVFFAFHSFVTQYEEPNLRERFGAAYNGYCKRVPRWIPRKFRN